uniref:Reverse transcriptase Ty1/copia-type domain-containing protein n=1 Tax=Lactuca sativa TaxID=4236 RepID=A0A9R1WR54_LACSA|nr:hypothetical protein LSAT_V11C900485730 [Lactuca sativa]
MNSLLVLQTQFLSLRQMMFIPSFPISHSVSKDQSGVHEEAVSSNQEDFAQSNTNEGSNPIILPDHPESQIIGDLNSRILTHSRVNSNICMFVNFVSMIEPTNVADALKEANWTNAKQDELNEFEHHRVWTLVPKPQGNTIIRTCWVFINKIDEDGIIIKNKPRLVAQGFCQLEGLDYDESFALIARLEAILLFLAFASFKNFKVYQMDVKTAFLHGFLQEEVFLKQPPGFENEEFPDHEYHLDKFVYGLNQSPRAWYDTLSSYVLLRGYKWG